MIKNKNLYIFFEWNSDWCLSDQRSDNYGMIWKY